MTIHIYIYKYIPVLVFTFSRAQSSCQTRSNKDFKASHRLRKLFWSYCPTSEGVEAASISIIETIGVGGSSVESFFRRLGCYGGLPT